MAETVGDEKLAEAKAMAALADSTNSAQCIKGEYVFYMEHDKGLIPGHIYSMDGVKEMGISNCCEFHFDEMFGPDIEAEVDLVAMGKDLRATYWRALGDNVRAETEPSDDSLTAWMAVAQDVVNQ